MKGGVDLPHITRRVLNSIMTADVASTYNWAGHGEKKAFKATKVNNLVLCKILFY